MKQLTRTLLVTISASLVLTACGDSSATEETASSEEMQEITVATLPIIHQAPLYLGLEKGFFEEEGLDVTAEIYQGFQPMIAATNNDEAQFGFTSTTPILAASTTGIPLQLVSAGDRLGNDDTVKSPDAVIFPADSDYSSLKDLTGETVGVSNLQGIQHLAVMAGIDNDGGDSSQTQFVSIPFADVIPALDSDRVSVATTTEPYLSSGQEDVEVLSYYFAKGLPDLPTTSYFATSDYVSQNPEIVEAFSAAIEKSTEYAVENPDEVREVLKTFTQIPEEVLAEVALPSYDTELKESDVQTLSDLLLNYEFIEEPVDVEAVFN